jgi:hypothetical protein
MLERINSEKARLSRGKGIGSNCFELIRRIKG